MAPLDPHSFTDSTHPLATHISLTFYFDFPTSTIHSSALITIPTPHTGTISLDSRSLSITHVLDPHTLSPIPFSLSDSPDPIKGHHLKLALSNQSSFLVSYVTSPSSSAIQWLSPPQTLNKSLPFCFTQCQAIHARAVFPCQDTPAARICYSARLNVPKELSAVMSAKHVARREPVSGEGLMACEDAMWTAEGRVVDEFVMEQPIPPYLFAFAVGELGFKEVGPRTRVYAEAGTEVLEKAAKEFEGTEDMIRQGERLFGPYEWERFDLLVLPPSFPYGGMENPRMVFLTPTVIKGDASGAQVVAHELAHSWTGNLITNKTNEPFWLNEGFTTYAERRIVEAVQGPDRAALNIGIGWRGLNEEMERFKDNLEFTKLKCNQEGIDPDDVYSQVPYEKGFQFLWRIERQVGRPAFDNFLKKYIATFKFQSIDTETFLTFLKANIPGIENDIDLQLWTEGTGIPPDALEPDSNIYSKIVSLADEFKLGKLPGEDEVSDWQGQDLPKNVDASQLKMDHHEDESHDGSRRNGKKDNEEAIARLKEIKKSMEAKLALRKNNLNPERPDAGFLRNLDSSIKRNTAVIKKLKQINEEQKDALLDELRSVNLSKFVSEAVAAICEAKLKSADIQAAIQICSLLHQRYKDFSPTLAQGLLKVFAHCKSVEDAESDKNTKAMKKRSTLKLLVELFFVGVIEDSSIFSNIIKDLTSAEHLRDRDTTQTNLSLLASFARQGRIFLGLPLSGQEIHEEFFKAINITTEQKKLIRKAFLAYFDAVAELLQSEHSSLRQMEHENAKILNAKGELSEDVSSSYEKLRKSYDQLYRNISSLAEALDMQPPVMPEDSHTTRVTMGEDGSSPVAAKDLNVPEPIWDDEDTKAFYESLPDLRAFVPAVLLGEAESKVNEQPSKAQDSLSDMAPDSDQGQVTSQGSSDAPSDIVSVQERKSNENGKDKEEKQNSKEKEKLKDLDKEKLKDSETHRKGDAEKDKTKILEGTSLGGLLQRLPGCVSRDLIDQLTVEFCYLNSKANRKKLVRALFNVPRTSLELLPYYSRMVSTLSTCMKDISSVLVQMLEEEFSFLINKKDQMNIETKIRNIRFIGELCKFKVAPPGLVFSCLKACLDDFTHHNIDVACNLLETCGRFLYRSPETSPRMANMLGTLMRLKNVKNLDPRHSTLVENAYYLCKPPERSARVSKVRPPLHQYIRKLLFTDLDKTTMDHVLRQLRKLPWDECAEYLLKCFMKVHKGKYGQIHLIALLTAGLSRYHDEFGVGVVDEVLEEIRVGLELNEYGMQQKRIAHMRYLGELYNFELADSSVIFETLYILLVFGHGTAEQDVLDPPEDFFRIRMVITLLQTCGQYFGRGSSKKKLDRYLLYFQRYIISKGAIPLDIEFDLQDLFAALRPNMMRFTSLEEVDAALVDFEESERTSSHDKTNSDKKLDGEKRSSRSNSNGKSDANGISENGEIRGDSESEHSIIDPAEEESDQHGSDSEDDEDDEGGPAVSDEDEAVRVRQKVSDVDPLEEAEFEQQLKSVIQESLESRRQDMRSRPTSTMMIPMNLFEGSAKDQQGRGGGEGESGDEAAEEECGDNKEVQVKVLVKRGNKNRTRQMFIPRDCLLVHSSKQQEAAELEEKQDIKRLVLEYNEREEEEVGGQGQSFMQPGNIRGFHRGSTWEGSGGRGGRFYYKPHHHAGNEGYYSRKR